mmetsp:Transcript_45667/g.114911  ORF Transcript_45667/g.114911 Transcript_45667/m.114911 type:complete len:662 (-) Transcript_45667:433-2418(-)
MLPLDDPLPVVLFLLIPLSLFIYIFIFRSKETKGSGTSSSPPPPISKPAAEKVDLKPEAKAEEKKDGTSISIIFGSQTGTAEEFAMKLKAEANSHKFKPTVYDAEEYDTSKLCDEKLVIFVVATYGEGEPTDNFRDFWEWLNSSDREDESPLEDVNYVVFGLGNKTYEHYNHMARLVDKRMAKLGASSAFQRGEGDDDGTLEDDFMEWKARLWPSLTKQFLGKTDTTEMVAQHIQRIKVKVHKPQEEVEVVRRFRTYSGTATAARHVQEHEYDMKNPLITTVNVNRELHTLLSDRSCRHVEINATDLRYEPGDHLAVYPANDPALVDALLTRLGLDGSTMISVFNIDDKEERFPLVGPLSLCSTLLSFVDITSPPRKSVLESLSHFTTDPAEKEKLKLMSSGSEAATEEYNKTIREPHRCILEVLELFPSIKLPLDAFLDINPRLAPRYYSISSSQAAHPDSVHATVAVVNFTTPTGRFHNGVCSTWLQRQEPGAEVAVYIRKSTFHLPADPSIPILMIGPGTGLAPFRGFIEQRAATKASGKTVFFFGCRRRDTDYIYEEELKQYVESGVLTHLSVAFSREQDEKVYVQHKMREEKDIVWDVISNNGYVYVCGDARYMAKDVHQALIDVAAEVGGMSETAAEEFISKLQADGKYLQDVWF